MRKTQLILLDGIPGSGKSTMAHILARRLTRLALDHIWWYEEDQHHPLYVFHDALSLQQLLDTLNAGHYQQVINAVLAKWRQFVEQAQASTTVVIFDGCLFGYLTWTLFPLDVPPEVIHAYLARVEEIIRPLNPCLIYFYQNDVEGAIKRIFARRDSEIEQNSINNVDSSPYGKRRGLQGFAGLVSYWQAYRHFTDIAYSRLDIAKLAIENSAQDWHCYEQQVLNFLELSNTAAETWIPENLERYTGKYSSCEEEHTYTCVIYEEQGQLLLDGMPEIWPCTRLLPLSSQRFAIESFPLEIQFREDGAGDITSFEILGPQMLFGLKERVLMRV